MSGPKYKLIRKTNCIHIKNMYESHNNHVKLHLRILVP